MPLGEIVASVRDNVRVRATFDAARRWIAAILLVGPVVVVVLVLAWLDGKD